MEGVSRKPVKITEQIGIHCTYKITIDEINGA